MTFTEINTVSKFKNQANNEVIIVKNLKKQELKECFLLLRMSKGKD